MDRPEPLADTPRLSELDWVRVFTVFAVFLHHVGMPFNGDDWIVMNGESSKLLDDLMVYFEQFRLPTLFMIAGVGAGLLLSNKSPSTFIYDKVQRLFLPLIVGIMLINPPQVYFAAPENYESLWTSYPELAFRFEALHLWFIEYLLVFSLFAVPVFLVLRSSWAQPLRQLTFKLASSAWALLSLGLLLALMVVLLRVPFPSDDKDIVNLSSSLFYFFFFLMGLLLIVSGGAWSLLQTKWRTYLVVFIGVSVVFYIYYLGDFSWLAPTQVLWQIWWAVGAFLAWSGVLAILSVSQNFLKTAPRWLTRANTLIYPFYILHQTVIVVLAYTIVTWDAGITLKLLALLLASFGVTSLICVFVIRPFNPLRFLFGMKRRL